MQGKKWKKGFLTVVDLRLQNKPSPVIKNDDDDDDDVINILISVFRIRIFGISYGSGSADRYR